MMANGQTSLTTIATLTTTADAALCVRQVGSVVLLHWVVAEATFCVVCCCGLQATPRVLTAQQPVMKHWRQQNS
jgi:hypothetical protein